jgi:hypothetical protein
VVFAGKWKSPVPPVARGYWPQDLAWYGLAHGHVLIGRGMKQLWRSHDTYIRGRYIDIGAVVLGRGVLAFSYYVGRQSRVLTARYGGRERLVARGEVPLLFAGSGRLVTWRDRGGALVLRGAGGEPLRTLATKAADPQVDRANRVLFFRSAGQLFAFDGVRVRPLAPLRELGMTGVPTVEPLGGLVAVHDRRRLVVMGYEGRRFASVSLPRSRHRADGVSSPVASNGARTAVAFSVTSGNRLRETVYLLVKGNSRAEPLFAEKLVGGNGCGGSDWLAWQGKWLLYANGGQQAAVIDSSGQAPAIDLSKVIAQLPGIRTDGEGAFNVEWA